MPRDTRCLSSICTLPGSNFTNFGSSGSGRPAPPAPWLWKPPAMLFALMLNFFVGLLLLLGRRAAVPPQTLKDILIPLATLFLQPHLQRHAVVSGVAAKKSLFARLANTAHRHRLVSRSSGTGGGHLGGPVFWGVPSGFLSWCGKWFSTGLIGGCAIRSTWVIFACWPARARKLFGSLLHPGPDSHCLAALPGAPGGGAAFRT